MKNKETWAFAHRCCGRYWLRLGWPVLIFSGGVMACVFDGDMNTISTVGTVVVTLQLIPFLITLPITEAALRRSFDSSGRRIETT